MRRTDDADSAGAARPWVTASAVGAHDTARRGEERLEWNDAQIAQLRALWAQGLTTPQIARQMGTSKNAIVGKARRLHLPSRPSPIKRDEPALAEHLGRVRAAIQAGNTTDPIAQAMGISTRAVDDAICSLRRRGKLPQPTATLPPLASLSMPAPQVAPVVTPPAAPSSVRPYTPGQRQTPVAPPPTVAAPPAPSVVAPPAPARYGRVIQCCWPIGEPARPGFRFCDDPSAPGKPYCPHHALLAYVKPVARRDGIDAAA